MQRRKDYSASSVTPSVPRRGRPPKQKRAFHEVDLPTIVLEFRSYPLRNPVDAHFQPYYQRMLRDDSQAIEDYLNETSDRPRFDASFYELIGRLTEIRSRSPLADQILKNWEHRDLLPNGYDVYRHWYEILKPLCRQARRFIQKVRAARLTASRAKLWQNYVWQPLPTVRHAALTGSADEERLQAEENQRHKELRRSAVEELLEWSETYTRDSVRSYLETERRFQGPELDVLTESQFYQEHVDRFRPFNWVPREIFFDLAKTKPSLTPSIVARRYACKIARVSESWASHKNVRT